MKVYTPNHLSHVSLFASGFNQRWNDLLPGSTPAGGFLSSRSGIPLVNGIERRRGDPLPLRKHRRRHARIERYTQEYCRG